ncbi:hypothetical protein Tco_0469494 [Tanacetum coccineum]
MNYQLLDCSADALSDFASSCSSSDHSLPALPSGMRPSHHLCSLVPSIHSSSTDSERPSHDSSSASPSRKRSRSPIASVPLSSLIPGALSSARADLLPSPKRIRSPESATDLEGCSEDSFEPYVPREVGLGVDFEDESSEPSKSREADVEMDVDVERSDGIDIDLEIRAEIDECFAYADALRAKGIDARVIVEAVDREEIEMGMKGPVEVRVDRVTHPVIADDIPKPAQEGDVEVTYETLGDLVQRFHDHTVEIPVHRVQAIKSLEQDNRRLRDIVDVESQRVTHFWCSLRLVPGGIWVTILRLFRDFPSVDSTMPNTRSGASRTREGVNEQSDRRMAEALKARDAVRNLGPFMGDDGEQEEVNGNGGNENGGNRNGRNRNGGDGNGNGNRGGYDYNFRGFMPSSAHIKTS